MILLSHHCLAILYFGENTNLGTFLTIDVDFFSVLASVETYREVYHLKDTINKAAKRFHGIFK